MPRVDFTQENKVTKGSAQFERLKLDGEATARIAIVESPVQEYEHTIQIPLIINGVPQKEMKKTKAGEDYEAYKTEYVSRLLCSGDTDTLANSGTDPENCIVCAYTREHKGRLKNPAVRYAMHVLKYKTKPGEYEVSTPFSVELPVWSFTGNMFNRLADLRKQWEELGGFKDHDLLLKCTNEKFQQYEIAVAPNAAYQKDEKTKAIAEETFENNQIEDLSLACGQRKELNWVQDDLKKVSEAWNIVERVEGLDDGDSASLEQGLSGLLDSEAPQAVSSAPASAPAASEPVAEDESPKETTSAQPAKAGFGDLF